MSTRDKQQHEPQPQTAGNPHGTPVSNPFENNRPVDDEIQQASEELEKEQQFKEAQTERD
ncbi:MAG TPA: hypothetical protein VMR70_16085 [Flavisolibacter sp.]|nr:hypothetical protein [Flavisolibacter sp.]